VSIFLCCHKEEERCDARNFRKIVRPILQEYFPYKAGQTLLFKKYQDTTFVENVLYTVNVPFYLKTSHMIKINDYGCYSYDTTETYIMNITCDSDSNKGIVIKYEGNYAKGLYDSDKDLTDLNLKFNNNNFSFYNLAMVIEEGNSNYELDSIVLFGKNYGKSFYVKNYPECKIYFNSKYGILKFENETTKEKYICAD
jgi:hypothetical protein